MDANESTAWNVISQAPAKEEAKTGKRVQLIIFRLGGEEYGVTIDQIKEVVLTPNIAQVPRMPSYIKGVANIRGNIIAILDLEERFNLSRPGEEKSSSIGNYTLVIESTKFKVGILVTPPAGEALVPSLILQPMIENAVKYGISKREEGGRIEIIARVVDEGVLDIVLRDNGPGSLSYRPERADGQGVGITNTRERLRVLYGDRQHFEIVRLQPQGTEVRLQFPFETASENRNR